MKPKEYVKKYQLDQSTNFNHQLFVGDLALDFISLVDFHSQTAMWNYDRFKWCIDQMKQKYDSISNRTCGTGLFGIIFMQQSLLN